MASFYPAFVTLYPRGIPRFSIGQIYEKAIFPLEYSILSPQHITFKIDRGAKNKPPLC